ncbi:MAG: periplasmic chaperone [Smithella sp. PtaU1.Bin162]|jgi:outer membrane protein|nr:MAG: periplasmic chaperone [Smithella sp. PtaU1.Bin162]
MNNLKVTQKNVYLIAGFVLMFFIFTNSNVFANDKIGFINLREIMQNSTNGKKLGDEFKKLYDKKNEAIKTTETDLKKMKDALDKQAASGLLTPAARKEKETVYQKKLRDYQILIDDTNKELKAKDEEIAAKLIPEIMKVVRAVAEREKFTLVMDIASMPVPYAAKENDISKKIIEEYNKQPQQQPQPQPPSGNKK